MATTPILPIDRLIAHARATAHANELHAPVNEKVGPEKLYRWGHVSMMDLKYTSHGTYSPEEQAAYTSAYVEEYQQSRVARLAETPAKID